MHRRIAFFLLAGTVLCACTSKESVQPDTSADAEGQIIQDDVQRDDFDPNALPIVNVPGFSVSARVMKVLGEEVMLFEYPDREEVEKEMDGISSDGSTVNDATLTWTGPIHFYATNTQIAVYLGSTPGVIELLEKEGGKQFAGTEESSSSSEG